MMRRIVIFTIGMFLLALGGLAVASDLPLVVADDFSNGTVGEPPADWTLVMRNSPDSPHVVDDVTRSQGHALRLGRERGNPHITNGVIRFFDPLRERAVVTFWFYATDLERTLSFSLAGQEQGTNVFGGSTGPFLVLRNGAVQAYSDGQFQDAALYEPGRWHKVTLDIDVRQGMYDVYFDDSEEPGNFAPFRFRNANIDNIASFGLSFQAATADRGFEPVYVDDLEVRGR